ncbi:hypothetical protein E1287_33430 [Actinomadura sp. KC06]|uniref:hypothetical protein n=1 Tax=Actinomadura sp. KC06 TaxID=2530369 RepID=UPI001048783E|nr:hypothetical protein [Actinomadura sp. KC06]TDD28032.1 hypothetical protein E1287_33430 [Actinomadura sp. KC06]
MARGPSNDFLRALLAEAEWTGQDLARAVNVVGAEAGLGLRYGRASVSQWVSGTRPRDPGPALVAEALSRRLGRSVTAAEAGFAGEPDVWWGWSLPAKLAELAAAAGADRRAARRVCVYRLAACEVPVWRTGGGRPQVTDLRGAGDRDRPVGWTARMAGRELELATIVVRLLSMVDQSYGGGVMRAPASAFLAHVVGPWLNAPLDGRARGELMAVCSQLAHLCGFMSFDDHAQGPAQRFYRTSLLIASDGGRREEFAWALRAMSVQAHSLGHFRPALQLAESAVSPRLTVLTRASVSGQVAVALASTGSRRRALREIGKAEELLDRALDTPSHSVGSYHRAALAFQKATVHAHLHDPGAALEALREALPLWSAAERRSRAITLARMAELELGQGLLEEAVATAHRFLDDCSQIHSARVRGALTGLRARFRPHGKNQAARALLQRAAQAANALGTAQRAAPV